MRDEARHLARPRGALTFVTSYTTKPLKCRHLLNWPLRAGVHPAHLSKAFRAAFGASPVEFGRQYRAAWTRQKIESSPMSLSRLAAEAGYADHSHMCRDLRRRYGVAPHQLRAGEAA